MTTNFTISRDELPGLEKAAAKGLCDHCLGRILGKRGRGMGNDERGGMIRSFLPGNPEKVSDDDCWLCEGLVGEHDHLAEMVAKALEPYGYSTFLMGSKVDAGVKEREKALVEIVGTEELEEIRSEVNREVGKKVCDLTGKDVDHDRPDIVVILDTRFDKIKLEVRSVYIYGRYRKFKRGIPQTKWPCKACRGKGCKRCNGTGRMYDSSVEELVAGPVVEALEGSGQSFHGMGREDIDARMLGNGRPFVLEVKEPRKRDLPPDALKGLEKDINGKAGGDIEVEGLRPSSKHEVMAIKDRKCFKTYEVGVEVAGGVGKEAFTKAVKELEGTVIEQRTPVRVSHRRGDLVRKRLVKAMDLKALDGERAMLTITGEAGIYIKELISGDEGRTVPNLAGLLGLDCRVLTLDVNRIHDEGTEE